MNVLITGARSGIGYEVAKKLAKKKCTVYLSVHTNEQLKTIKIDTNKDEYITCLKLDITNEKDREKVKKLDIDVLINNAAIGIGGSIINTPTEKIIDNYIVNVFGTIEMTKTVLTPMVEKNNGKIITIISNLSEFPMAFFGIYASTKAALKNIFIALSKELKIMKSRVKVVLIEPGAYKTGFNQVMIDSLTEDKIKKQKELMFSMIEEDNLNSIVDKIVEATLTKNPNFIYKAPFSQKVFTKIYSIINR